ncbi:LysE family translocator [Actinospica durhamensis]|uniref:LysE family translocator n=1 Tax=Actinospica durhamensis TaxID=1508375 RepID=A0A941EZI9_9ACTN|nr:LysE family translocator [Actinospica durhamensis]MBR7839482.1 LysE family translocator [Actinospica durhamensis]
MRPAVILAFLAAVFPLVATPGASFSLLIREVTAHGRRRALPVILGTVTGLYVHATLAIAGLSALVMHSSDAFEAVRLAGAAYLIALGVSCLRTGSRPPVDATQDPNTQDSDTQGPETQGPDPRPTGTLVAYRHALLANVLNPKAASIFLTLIPQFLDPHRHLAPQILTLATAQGLLVCTWLACWTAVLAGARRLLSSTHATSIWKRATGCVLVGLGLRSALA